MRTTTIAILVAVLALSAATSLQAGDKKVTIDEAAIYYGNSSNFEKPGTVDVNKVYNKIPEYQEIIRLKLKDSDAKYTMLMRTATDKFLNAIQAVADDKGYDLIGASGSIQIEGVKVPDITSYVIAELPNL
jgi:hypothetical protein